MLRNRFVLAIAWLLLGAFPFAANASRTIVPAGKPYVVDVWGIEDGLPQSTVISILQTHDGYLWLGTLNGLARFDGLNFTIFDESNTHGLAGSRVLHLFEDQRENLWVGMESGSISLIRNNGRVQSFELGRNASGGRAVSSWACDDGNGTVWMLTENGLLARFLNDNLSVTAVGGARAVLAEKSGTVWLGTDQALASLQKTPPNSAAFLVDQFISVGHLDFVLASRTGGYWRLADGRIQKWKGDQREKDYGSYPWGSTPITAACEDLEGNLVVGTYGDGVYWLQSNRTVVHLANELSHSSVLSVLVDREGNLWVGTNGGGLNRVKRRVFGTVPESEGLVVQSACADKQGGIWIGYNGESRVDYRSESGTRTFRMIQDPNLAKNCDVKSVFVDNAQMVFAGMRFNGDPRVAVPRLFEFQNGTFHPASKFSGLHDNVSVLFQDHAGTQWAGTENGLARWADGAWKYLTTNEGLAGNDIRGLAESTNGTLWIATGAGLSRLENGTFTSYRKSDGLPSDDLSCVYLDGDGALWIGTRGSGLVRFFQNKWTRFTMHDGLAGNSIGYILEDGADLWIGSNAGLMRVLKKSLSDFADGKAESFVCRAYVESDGLPTRECTQGSQPAACRSADGTLWFPTTKGLVHVNPAALEKNSFQPPVIIESVRVEGVEQITNRLRALPLPEIVVPPGKEHLEIRYTSLNLGAAKQSRFRYRLAEHEHEWNLVGNIREARYSRLPPGEYHFQVAAANEDGIWNEVATVQLIRVLPPFWKTQWFIAGTVLVLLGLIVGTVYYFSTQRLQRELAELKQHEELEKERARIARDLHDQLGANLMQVALLGELAEADKDLPNEVEDHAKQIYQTARETTKALDEIVWAVNPSNDTLDGLVNYICKYAQEYFELADLKYRIEVPANLPDVTLPPEVRHNVFLAAKEAVNNVVKHAQASSAWLRLKLESDRFTIEIEDDGRGLGAMNEKTGRNGLRNMRKRLEDVGGRFSIEPGREKGAVVQLSAPVRKR